MLEFEAALARAEAAVGVIPQRAADAIARQCDAAAYDAAGIAADDAVMRRIEAGIGSSDLFDTHPERRAQRG